MLTLSINWDTWREVGMAADAALSFGPKGIKQTPHGKTVDHPLLDQRFDETLDGETYLTEFSPMKHWVLDEHRIILGDGVIPGTAYLEMARAAFEKHARNGMIEVRNLFFVVPLRVKDDEKREVHTIIRKDGDAFKFLIKSKSSAPKKGEEPKWQEHAIGKIRDIRVEPARKHHIKALIEKDDVAEITITEEEQEKIKERGLGPRWNNIKKVYVGTNEVLALLELSEEFFPDLEKFKLHPALLDMATGLARLYIAGEGDYLPLSYKRLRIRGPLPGKIYSYARFRDDNQTQKETVTYDLIITDEDGVELVEIEEFTTKRVNNSILNIKAQAEMQGPGVEDHQFPLNGAEGEDVKRILQNTLMEGISSAEGVEVFRRILSIDVPPQIVVSTRDLHALIELPGALTQARVLEEIGNLQLSRSRPTHSRPSVQSPYVAPSGEVERSIAELWQEMLGVEPVGVNDNFFELGGDSVLAIQIISRAQQSGLKFTPQQLFQHPTVAELAAVADTTQATQAEESAGVGPRQSPEAENQTAMADFPLAGLDAQQLSELATLLDKIDGAD